MPPNDPPQRKGPDAAVSPLRQLYGADVAAAGPVWSAAPSDAFSEGDVGIDLLHYWNILWKHRWIILGAAAAGVIIATTVTLLTTPVYTAETTLQIDREAAKVVNIQEVTPREDLGQSEEFYQTQYGLLRNTALANRVIGALSLESAPAFLHASGLDRNKYIHDTSVRGRELFHQAVLKEVMHSLGVNPVRGSRLVDLTYDSPDSNVAAQVVNSFATNFIEMNLARRYEASSYARNFLETQLATVKARLEDSERQAVNYAVSQQIITLHDADTGASPGEAEPLVEKNLAALDAAYASAQADRIAAEAKWSLAKATPGLGLPEVLQNQAIQELSQEEAKLQSKYEQQLQLFKPGYPEMRQLKAQIDELNARIGEEANTIKSSLYESYRAALQKEQSLQSQVDALKQQDLNLKDRSIAYGVLQREVDTNRVLYNGLLERYKEIGVTAGIASNNISVVNQASPPLKPSKPRLLVNLALGLIAGLGLGGMAAFGAEVLDQALREPKDIEIKLGVPLIGAIPLLMAGVTPEEAMKDPRSAFWEAHYSIRTALQFSTASGLPKSLAVSSALPSEGKSTTALAIAISLARIGARVLLVDVDLRKPTVHKRLGLQPGPGLSNYLTGGAGFSELVQSSEQKGLFVITSGPLPPTPAEILGSLRLRHFIGEAEEQFDVVILDGPPIMGFADAPIIGTEVTGVLLVVESGQTGRGHARAALHRLRMTQTKIIGAVLTKYDARKTPYGYGGGYGYGHYAYEYGSNQKKTLDRRTAAGG